VSEKQKNRKTEKQRNRETEKQRNRETEKQRRGKTWLIWAFLRASESVSKALFRFKNEENIN